MLFDEPTMGLDPIVALQILNLMIRARDINKISSIYVTKKAYELPYLINYIAVKENDGIVIREQHLKGKPAPDTFLAGARRLGVDAARAAVFEDAVAGVEAGRAGAFGWVVGVDRVGHADALRAHGADLVVRDLAELLDGAGA